MVDSKLDLDKIKEHWQNWATTYGKELRATTKTSTAKQIEIATLLKVFHSLHHHLYGGSKILELGCGNGHNLISMHKNFPDYLYEGIDYIQEMIASAQEIQKENNINPESMKFNVGDVLDLKDLKNDYDLIFTVRCLINLNSDQLQLDAIKNIASKLKPGGYLLMLENSQISFGKQNRLRRLVGLQERESAEFNHFFNDDYIISQLTTLNFNKIKVETFITIHDLVLYILVPMVNNGIVDYAHPMVDAATKLSVALSVFGDESFGGESFGDYGQNRLYLFQKQKIISS